MLIHPGRLTVHQSKGVVHAVSKGTLNADTTFTRADPATYLDPDGLLQTAAAGEARTTYIGGNPYLLMEGERTNLCLQSEDAELNLGGNSSTVTANDATAPDGTVTADKIELTSTGFHYKSRTTAIADKTFVGSVYLKAESNQTLRVRTVDSLDGSDGSTKLVTVTTEWERFSIAHTMDATNNTAVEFGIDVRAGGGGPAEARTVWAWGWQIEEASHESSYIKTTTASVTRAEDSASLANSIISGLTEGTIYAEVYTDHLTSDAARHIAELESDASNFIRVLHAADGDLDAQITDGGASQAALAGTDLTVGQLQKVALAFSEDDFALYRDGSQLATDSGGTVPSVDTLLIGAGLFGGIKTLNVYTSRLPNSQLATLTT